MSQSFSHIDAQGRATMVDVGGKENTRRTAVAQALVRMSAQTMQLLADKALPKGDALATARLAGIMAAKKTSELIPLCHPLALSFVDVDFEVNQPEATILVRAEARTTGPTGVEMEALAAASVAALTIYDMCKAVQKDIIIDGLRLVSKAGGKSGPFAAAL